MSMYVTGRMAITQGREIWLPQAPVEGDSWYGRDDEMQGYADWIGKVLQVNLQPNFYKLAVPTQLFLPPTPSRRGVKIWHKTAEETVKHDPSAYVDPGEEVGQVFAPETKIRTTIAGIALAPSRVAQDYENVLGIDQQTASHGGGGSFSVIMGAGNDAIGYFYEPYRHYDSASRAKLARNNETLRRVFNEAIRTHLGYDANAFEATGATTVADYHDTLKTNLGV